MKLLRERSSKFLYIGFALLMIAFSFMVMYAFQQNVTINQQLRHDIEVNDRQLRAAMTMRVAIRERSLLLWHMSQHTDAFDRDDHAQRFYIFGVKFAEARNNYKAEGLNNKEQFLFTALDNETRNRSSVLDKLSELLLKDAKPESYLQYLDKALSEQVVVADILDKLINLQQFKNEAARRFATVATDRLFVQVIMGISLIIIAVIVFARLVIIAAEHQVQELQEAQGELILQGEVLSYTNNQLEKMARYDHLTGLANRMLLNEHLNKTMALAKRLNKRGAMLYIDLDGFKTINDNYGHATGDAFLQAVSREMSLLLRISDIISRVGGDEFVVVLFEVVSEHEVTAVADKLLQRLSDYYEVAGIRVSVSASIGICYFTGTEENIDEVIDCADSAMYKAKQGGKNRYHIAQ